MGVSRYGGWKGDRRKLKGGVGVSVTHRKSKIKKESSADIKNHFFLSFHKELLFFFFGLNANRESLKNIPYLARDTFARMQSYKRYFVLKKSKLLLNSLMVS